MKNLEEILVRQKPFQIRRAIGRISGMRWNLHHVGGAVAGRQLNHAKPVAVEIEPHGLGIDRDARDAAAK